VPFLCLLPYMCVMSPLIADWLSGHDCLAQQWILARLCFMDSSTDDCPSSSPIQCTCSPLDANLMKTLRQVF
jgi:hypothetical protein